MWATHTCIPWDIGMSDSHQAVVSYNVSHSYLYPKGYRYEWLTSSSRFIQCEPLIPISQGIQVWVTHIKQLFHTMWATHTYIPRDTGMSDSHQAVVSYNVSDSYLYPKGYRYEWLTSSSRFIQCEPLIPISQGIQVWVTHIKQSFHTMWAIHTYIPRDTGMSGSHQAVVSYNVSHSYLYP